VPGESDNDSADGGDDENDDDDDDNDEKVIPNTIHTGINQSSECIQTPSTHT
jgi:hypothetical protein